MKIEQRYFTDGIYIRDRSGRVVLFRGCNLGGDSKIPAIPDGNPLETDVSFVGRPFPLETADEHFSRIAGWGFTVIRMVVTWEAVEHEGPGIYDEDYLAYLRDLLKKAEEYGLAVFIDPHQDVWSRWTGGDGAPRWTLEAVGIDPGKIDATGAAITVQGQGSNYKQMSWGLNYLRYAAATMNTLFFAGNTFAPGLFVEGVPVQDWLQDHFIDAMNHTARRIKDCEAVIGFGIFNEPHPGFIGLVDVADHARITAPSGAAPSAFDAIVSASGFSRRIHRFSLFGKIPAPGFDVLNPDGDVLFKDGFSCPWLAAGVWRIQDCEPFVSNPGYFSHIPAGQAGEGTQVSFTKHFLKPFQKRFMQKLQKKHKHYLFFAEGVPMGERVSWESDDLVSPEGRRFPVIDAFHWYEGMTLLTKQWRPWLCADSEKATPVVGASSVKKSIADQLIRAAESARAEGVPAFLGEFGIPFDLNNGASYTSEDYSSQEQALGIFYDGIDAALLHATIWNYSASNTHEQGDFWNTEDLSVYCSTTGEGRAVRGFSRPYAMAVSGIPVRMRFDTQKRVFTFEWEAVPGCTEVFVPSHWYPEGWRTGTLPAGVTAKASPENQRLFLETDISGTIQIEVVPDV